jgi:hypothetical protein
MGRLEPLLNDIKTTVTAGQEEVSASEKELKATISAGEEGTRPTISAGQERVKAEISAIRCYEFEETIGFEGRASWHLSISGLRASARNSTSMPKGLDNV